MHVILSFDVRKEGENHVFFLLIMKKNSNFADHEQVIISHH